MRKIFLGLGFITLLGLGSCHQGGGAKYQAINRQRGIILVDQQTGEVFLMNIVAEKGEGVVGSEWKAMGSPSQAK